jgi:hypothetical protein
MTMKQLMELVGQGLEVTQASTIDTTKWGKETKPKSDKIIPPKPKSNTESPKLDDRSQREKDKIFLLKVEIKTGKEVEIIKRIGMECKFVGEEAFCRATHQQVEELKKEGIEFEVQKEKRKGEK